MSQDIRKGKGFGFIATDGRICMQRCFECGVENYAMAVMSGQCAWCGHDANDTKTQEHEKATASPAATSQEKP